MTAPTVPELLKRLDELYDKEDNIKKVLALAQMEFEQIQEDKELLQSMIMHQSNKRHRFSK